METLIVGNLGYLGPTVTKECREVSDVDGLDAGWFVGQQLVDLRYGADVRTQFIWDLRDISPEFLADYDNVVCLGAVSNDPIGGSFEDATFDINNIGTRLLIDAAKEGGVRHFVFASSCSIYGNAGAERRQEDDELSPLTAYARSKVAIEDHLKAVHDEGFSCSILRFATACGVSRHPRVDLVLNDFVASGVAYGAVNVLSDGTPQRPLITVNDMARAIAHVISNREALGEECLTVNVGFDDWNFTVRDLALIVSSELGLGQPTFAQGGGPDQRSYEVSFSRARNLPGWPVAELTLREAIQKLRDQYVHLGINYETYSNHSLRRLATLNLLLERNELNRNLRWVQ